MWKMHRTYVAALLVLCLSAWNSVAARAEDEIDKKAIAKAHEFLKTETRGRHILGYVHFDMDQLKVTVSAVYRAVRSWPSS